MPLVTSGGWGSFSPRRWAQDDRRLLGGSSPELSISPSPKPSALQSSARSSVHVPPHSFGGTCAETVSSPGCPSCPGHPASYRCSAHPGQGRRRESTCVLEEVVLASQRTGRARSAAFPFALRPRKRLTASGHSLQPGALPRSPRPSGLPGLPASGPSLHPQGNFPFRRQGRRERASGLRVAQGHSHTEGHLLFLPRG